MAGCIVGWAHTPFGKLPEEDVEGLIARVATQAVADAGLEPEDIGAVYLGVMNNGFSKQDFTAGMIAQADPRFRFTPATRLENACATGSAAIHAGLTYLAAKRGKFVLVVGAEKMTAKSVAEVSDILLGASYRREEAAVDGGFAGIFGQIAGAYFAAHGDQSDALARIAAKNHRNGVDNPYAQLRKDLGYEFCRTVSAGNPLVAGPLRRTDCSPISDGAAAIVLADEETARGMRRAVRFRAAVQVNDYLPLSRRSQTAFEGAAAAWRQGFGEAGVALADLELRRDARLLHHRRADRVRSDGAGARGPRRDASSRKAGPSATAGSRSTAPAASRRRATRSARPACRCTPSPPCS